MWDITSVSSVMTSETLVLNSELSNRKKGLPHSSDPEVVKPGRKLVGINGNWYDVTNFIPVHPGGPVIEQMLGKESTTLFRAFHKPEVLKLPPVGTYTRVCEDKSDEAFNKLYHDLVAKGLFKTDYFWYCRKFLFTFSLVVIAFVLMLNHNNSLWMIYGSAIFVSLFWQQAGFLMHDFMHGQVLENHKLNKIFGLFLGGGCFGVSSTWWHDEHRVHHAITNGVDLLSKFYDPQMVEATWAQSPLLFPFYTKKFHYYAIKVQHITFIPLCVIGGRLQSMWDSYSIEVKPLEWAVWIFHWLWVGTLMSYLPTWSLVFKYYAVASAFEGLVHIQLLLSHYAKPFCKVSEMGREKSWGRAQVEANMNLTIPWWFEWFHGGLNLHIEHHLYPKMPRHHFREAGKYVKEVCQREGIHYDERGYFQAVWDTLCLLKNSSEHFKLDPR